VNPVTMRNRNRQENNVNSVHVLSHHQYECIDHSNDGDDRQTADELDSILRELEINRLRKQN